MNETPKGNETPRERITASALRYKGEIFTGPNHGEALIQLLTAHPDARVDERNEPNKRFGEDIAEGFVTSHGRFISPDEADTLWRGKKFEE